LSETQIQSKLDAVNRMLASIGETPVAVLSEETGNADISLATSLLEQTSRAVQGEGWDYNSDYNWDLVPDINKQIVIPSNVLRVDPCDRTLDYVQRSGKLYDRSKRTFDFDDTVKADIIWLLPFEELPYQAREYIMIRSARIFQDKTVGATDLHGYDAQDEARARADMESADSSTNDTNAFAGEYGKELYRR
jgi:hypothetical protein